MIRFVRHEANLVQSVADTMVTLIREHTTDPDAIESAQELVNIFAIGPAPNGTVPFAGGLRPYGLRGAAQSSLTFQVAEMRPHMKEYHLGGQAHIACN